MDGTGSGGEAVVQGRGGGGRNSIFYRYAAWPLKGRRLGLLVALVAAGVGMWRQLATPPETIVGRPHLVDGDSFTLNGFEIRMLGIDAPEGRQSCTRDGRSWPCGEAAREHLQGMIGNREVRCEVDRRDQHTRVLATCKVGMENLNRAMVRDGFAVGFGKFYQDEEKAARNARRGIWAGEFERPQDWRRERGIGR